MSHFLLAARRARGRRRRRARGVALGSRREPARRPSASRCGGGSRSPPPRSRWSSAGTFATAAGPHPGRRAKVAAPRHARRVGLRARARDGGLRDRSSSSCSATWLAPARALAAARSAPRWSCSALLLVQMVDRRDPVPHAPALGARARPRRARGRGVGRTRRRSSRSCGAARRSAPQGCDVELAEWPSELRVVQRPTPRAARADRRLPRLERRRAGRVARRRATSRRSGRPSGSPTSTRRTSTTSRRRGRSSRSRTG